MSESTKFVTYLRKGQPVQVDRQVYLWRRRNRIAKRKAAERLLCLQAIIDHFSGDQEMAKEWLQNHELIRYKGVNPITLLKNHKLKGIYRELKELDQDR